MYDWILAHASHLAISAFTVFASLLVAWTGEQRAKRHLRAADEVRKDYTAARRAAEMAARLQIMRDDAARAEMIRVATEQAEIAQQAAKVSEDARDDAKRWAYQVDKILDEQGITRPDPMDMAVTAGDPDEDEAPDTERSGVVVCLPRVVRP